MSDVKSNWICGKKQAEIWIIAIGTGIKTSRAKPNALHKFFPHLRKTPYIVQIAAIAISVMQIPTVNITDFFKSKDNIASSGKGITLTTTKLWRTSLIRKRRTMNSMFPPMDVLPAMPQRRSLSGQETLQSNKECRCQR